MFWNVDKNPNKISIIKFCVCVSPSLSTEGGRDTSFPPHFIFWEEKVDHSLPMLDTLTTRDNEGGLSFTAYRKKTHTDQHLQYRSNQPLQHKLGKVKTNSQG